MGRAWSHPHVSSVKADGRMGLDTLTSSVNGEVEDSGQPAGVQIWGSHGGFLQEGTAAHRRGGWVW